MIARELANHILDENLPEGTMLSTEREMIDRLEVGRNTIREALRLLETRGVISIKPGRSGGPIVLRPKASNLGEALTLILQFEKASLSDVLAARRTLEPMISRLAAPRISDDQLDRMRAAIERLQPSVPERTWLADHESFHSIIAEACGSVVLRIFSDSLMTIFDGAQAGVVYSPRRRQAAIALHTAMLEALERHDPDAAEKASLEHLNEVGKYWKSRYPELFDQPVRWMH